VLFQAFKVSLNQGVNKILVRFESLALRECSYAMALQVLRPGDGEAVDGPRGQAAKLGIEVTIPTLIESISRRNKFESAAAVTHWWGVALTTVRRWRRALGVTRCNAGTLRLREAGYDDVARSRKISKTKSSKSRGPLSRRWKAKISASVRRYHATNETPASWPSYRNSPRGEGLSDGL